MCVTGNGGVIINHEWFMGRCLAVDISGLFFDVLLTVHVSIFISVFNQLDAQNFVLQ